MSWRPTPDPQETPVPEPVERDVEAILTPRDRDLGGFVVRRLLPASQHRAVGPFVFFDHFGPTGLAPGHGLDVRPHPHINLATVTYLFDGEIVHRDSLGSHQTIRPGDVNWMTAGRGIVHSERSGPQERAAGPRIHGLQIWLALPRSLEEIAPAFHHHPAETLPTPPGRGAELRLIAGTAWGLASPVWTSSPLFYVESRMSADAALALPDEHQERAAYVVSVEVLCEDRRIEAGQMVIFAPGAEP